MGKGLVLLARHSSQRSTPLFWPSWGLGSGQVSQCPDRPSGPYRSDGTSTAEAAAGDQPAPWPSRTRMVKSGTGLHQGGSGRPWTWCIWPSTCSWW